MRRCLGRIVLCVVVVYVLFSMICVAVYAADTVEETAQNGAIGLGANRGGFEVSGTTVTYTNRITGLSLGTSYQIKIYNNSGGKAKVSFNYSGDSFDSFSFNEGKRADTYEATLDDGEFILIEASSKCSFRGQNDKLTITNLVLTPIVGADFTYLFDDTLGSITVDGVVVANDQTVSCLDTENGASLVATPKGDAQFVGWIYEADGKLLSTNSSCTVYPTANASLRAIFAEEDDDAWFLAGNAMMYNDLSDACDFAKTAATKSVVVMSTGVLPQGNYIIPSSVTLLIPYDSAHTLCTTAPTVDSTKDFLNSVASSWKKPEVYRKLKMASGANITVNGAISLSGIQCSYQCYNGMPTKSTSVIEMAENSSITVNEGGFLYAWGYITGSGEVSVMSGGAVYEDFQVKDWRGGTAALSMLNKDEKVFPVSQYYVQNVEVKMTLYAGAIEKAYMSLVASRTFGSTLVPFIGADGMFRLADGYLIKDYLENEDRLYVEIHGNLTMSALQLSISSYDMDSSKYVLPLTSNLYVKVEEGTTTVTQDLALLPGSELVIADGAEVEIASGVSVFVYDLAEWEGKLYVYSSRDVSPLNFVGATWGSPKARPTMGDAKIEVNGTLDASLGYLFTTTGGANICSTGAGKVITTGAYKTDGEGNDITITYQYIQSSSSYDEIPITPAKLKNEDGTYVETETATAVTTYNHAHYDCEHGDSATHGVWFDGEHEDVIQAAVDATCTTPGKTEGQYCACGKHVVKEQKVVSALGHTSVTDAAVAATCTTTGLTEGCHCSVCNEVLVAQEVIAALGHVWNWGGWSSATNGQQCTCTCDNDDSHTITVLLAYRMDSYIWLNATVSSNVGTPVCNEMTLQSTSGGNYLVQKVLSNHITDSVCVTFQVDEFGKTNKLEIGFLEYAKLLSADDNTTDATVKLLASMLMYGEASEDYFGNGEDATGNDNGTILTAYQTNLLNNTAIPERLKTALRACALSGHTANKNLLKPADTNANYGEKGLENGLTISTTGAAFYFDEALRLSVGYKFAEGATVNLDENGNPDGTITFGGTTYTVLQVGLLVQELKDWTMCNVLYAEDGVTAYIAYDNSAEIDPTGPENHPDVGEGGPDPFVNTLGKSGEINFDLLVKEYNSGFALRTYAVLEVNGTQYVIYGKQYGYGLEAYVKATYGVDTAFDPLLATAWGYAQAAAAR